MLNEVGLSPFDAAAILIVVSAALGWVNHRYLKLPTTVGLTIMGALASVAVIAIDRALPSSQLAEGFRGFLDGIDFHHTLMDGMLSFLLFAGALHVDLDQLRQGRWQIGFLSTVGVVVSTVLVGLGFWGLTRLFGLDVLLIWAFVFGALISPTDPMAVLGAMKAANVPKRIEATIGGESLFNDGVGVVIFSILLAAAASGRAQDFSLLHAGELFLVEAGGGWCWDTWWAGSRSGP